MKSLMTAQSDRAGALNVAFLSTYVPRRCGIATFTDDLVQGLGAPESIRVAALDGTGPRLTYPPVVRHRLRASDRSSYAVIAGELETAEVDLVSVQHEYGIFGGPSGVYLLDFLDAVRLPIVTTLHTILARPTPLQRRVLQRIADRSERVVSMTDRGRELLEDVYRIPSASIEVIPHGVPEFELVEPAEAKARVGLDGHQVILSFGLLGPHKRLELVIEALAGIADRAPLVRFAIVGATHPEVRRKSGEAYRLSLIEQAERLGVADRVVFIDRFLEDEELADWLSASDIFVTPYANAQQITSGSLVYALAAGTAVVSTPYEHASELLRDGRGVLIPFEDVGAIGAALERLLTTDTEREEIRRRAREHGRSFAWPVVAARYAALFDEVTVARRTEERSARFRAPAEGARVPVGVMAQGTSVGRNGHRAPERAISRPPWMPASAGATLPGNGIGAPDGGLPGPSDMPTGVRRHLSAMSDAIGIFQFSREGRPDVEHGYCADDVARCLRVDLRHFEDTADPKVAAAIRRDVAFLQDAFDPATGRFRNFRKADGAWLDAPGSEDADARAIHALGEAMALGTDRIVVAAARELLARALPAARELRHIRPMAAAILGVAAALDDPTAPEPARSILESLAERLAGPVDDAQAGDPSWPWPEPLVTYENGIVPEGLIAAGAVLGRADLIALGTDVLSWLFEVETAPEGWLRPIGNAGWWLRSDIPALWDQQPIEPASLVFAAAEAFEATGNKHWLREAGRATRWFLGENDGAVSLADPNRGACRDGLLPHGPNTNEGAESTLVWLLVCERVADLRQAGSSSRRRSGRGQDLTYSSTEASGAEEKAMLESAAP